MNNAAVKSMTCGLSYRGLFIVAAETGTFFNFYAGLDAGCGDVGFCYNYMSESIGFPKFNSIAICAFTLLNTLCSASCRNDIFPFR